MREVILKLTSQKDLIKHQSDAITFGQLKDEMKQVKWDGMRVVERSTKSTLQLDDAILPQGDFILFLVPEKVKSGMTKESGGLEELSDVENASYNQLRSHMSWLNRNKDAKLDVSGSTEDLKEALLEYKKNPASKTSEKKKDSKKKKKKDSNKVKVSHETKKETKTSNEVKVSISENSVGIIEGCREVINRTLDNLVECAIDGISSDGITKQSTALQYNIEDLEKEIEKIRNALKDGRYKKVD